jgi:hypothetical protein
MWEPAPLCLPSAEIRIRAAKVALTQGKNAVQNLLTAEDVGFELKILLTFCLVGALASAKRVVSRLLEAVRRRFATSGAAKCSTSIPC